MFLSNFSYFNPFCICVYKIYLTRRGIGASISCIYGHCMLFVDFILKSISFFFPLTYISLFYVHFINICIIVNSFLWVSPTNFLNSLDLNKEATYKNNNSKKKKKKKFKLCIQSALLILSMLSIYIYISIYIYVNNLKNAQETLIYYFLSRDIKEFIKLRNKLH